MIGFMATTFPGVRPSISLAPLPTATTSPLFLLMATMDGSLTTIPLPRANTRVLAVPRSIARSEENRLKTDRKLNPFCITSLDQIARVLDDYNFRSLAGLRACRD